MRSATLSKTGIGGSDVAAILGFHETRDAFTVWMQKRGSFEPTPATPGMRLGKLFERGIVEYYGEMTGREMVWHDETMQHPDRPWMIYTPDALCKGERRGVDAKLVSWHQRRLWGDDEFTIPMRVRLQCLWYMAAMDYPVWDVAALFGLEEPRIYTLDRDLDMEDEILYQIERFWRDCIIGGQKPPMGASEENARLLKQMFPYAVEDIRDASAEEIALLEAYSAVRLREKPFMKEIEHDRAILEGSLKLAIGDSQGLRWEKGKFTWKNTKNAVATDWEPLARSMMANLPEAERQIVIKEYTRTVPGTRRIHFRCEGLNDD
jgi:predicted phage-related endonuclease